MNGYRTTHRRTSAGRAGMSRSESSRSGERRRFVGSSPRDPSNPSQGEGLIARMLPLPARGPVAVVQRSLVGSAGLEDPAARLCRPPAARRLMIEKYLNGQLPTLDQAGFAETGHVRKCGYLGLATKRRPWR